MHLAIAVSGASSMVSRTTVIYPYVKGKQDRTKRQKDQVELLKTRFANEISMATKNIAETPPDESKLCNADQSIERRLEKLEKISQHLKHKEDELNDRESAIKSAEDQISATNKELQQLAKKMSEMFDELNQREDNFIQREQEFHSRLMRIELAEKEYNENNESLSQVAEEIYLERAEYENKLTTRFEDLEESLRNDFNDDIQDIENSVKAQVITDATEASVKAVEAKVKESLLVFQSIQDDCEAAKSAAERAAQDSSEKCATFGSSLFEAKEVVTTLKNMQSMQSAPRCRNESKVEDLQSQVTKLQSDLMMQIVQQNSAVTKEKSLDTVFNELGYLRGLLTGVRDTLGTLHACVTGTTERTYQNRQDLAILEKDLSFVKSDVSRNMQESCLHLENVQRELSKGMCYLAEANRQISRQVGAYSSQLAQITPDLGFEGAQRVFQSNLMQLTPSPGALSISEVRNKLDRFYRTAMLVQDERFQSLVEARDNTPDRVCYVVLMKHQSYCWFKFDKPSVTSDELCDVLISDFGLYPGSFGFADISGIPLQGNMTLKLN